MLKPLTYRLPAVLLTWAILTLGGGMARAQSAGECSEQEKWCEHKIATFCENQTCSNVRSEGQCIPKEKSCEEFWCGNRQCQSGWLISRNVCCVYYPADNAPEYSCRASELSCPGNADQLTIRPTTVASAQTE